MENVEAGLARRPLTAAPASTLLQRARGALASTWADWRTALLTALVAVALFRLASGLVATFSAYGGATWSMLLHHPGQALLGPWDHWDWAYYRSIAEHGYGSYANGIYQDNAFAPAYPLGIGALIRVLHIGTMPAGLLLSGASLVVACAALFKLAAEHGGDRGGRAAIVVLLAFPTAFFLAAPYSEPLSLAAVALALLAARRERWCVAGLAAGVATMSKYYLGVLVIALLVDHAVRSWRRGRRPQLSALAGITLPSAAGLLAIGTFMWSRHGDALYVLHIESSAWGHGLGTPVRLVHNAWREVTSLLDLHGYGMLRAFILDDLAILGLAAFTVWMLLRHREHLAELVMVVLTAVTFVCMSGPDSASRLVLPLAPLFVVLGIALARTPRRLALLAACGGIVSVLQLGLFAVGGWAG